MTVAEAVYHNIITNARDEEVLELVSRSTKDELENHQHDLLTLAVSRRRGSLVTALLARGLRSGFALDAAVWHHDLARVEELLSAGVNPSQGAENTAWAISDDAIANAIAKKRDENYWFHFRPEF